jgi:site-specific DNA-cytosine methylase
MFDTSGMAASPSSSSPAASPARAPAPRQAQGFDHPETVLWREMARAVRELRPRYVLVENVANILALHDGAVWGEVLGDLAALGFDVESGIVYQQQPSAPRTSVTGSSPLLPTPGSRPRTCA